MASRDKHGNADKECAGAVIPLDASVKGVVETPCREGCWDAAGWRKEMADGQDKRKFARCPLIAEIRYKSDSPVLNARISDISLGGLFVDTVNALELDTKVRFSLVFPREYSDDPIQGEGVVTWSQLTVGMGIRFTRMTRPDWEKIRSYIESCT